ncbi:hypothetical protein ADL21_06330 [Streptomyces albus subsp. albus]|nr:hypothetical protein ADL21_06330 [Streptomyces albus subsp. albus]
MGLFSSKPEEFSNERDPNAAAGGFVTTEKADGGTNTVIVLGDGVHVHHCPGGFTEDELLD